MSKPSSTFWEVCAGLGPVSSIISYNYSANNLNTGFKSNFNYIKFNVGLNFRIHIKKRFFTLSTKDVQLTNDSTIFLRLGMVMSSKIHSTSPWKLAFPYTYGSRKKGDTFQLLGEGGEKFGKFLFSISLTTKKNNCSIH